MKIGSVSHCCGQRIAHGISAQRESGDGQTGVQRRLWDSPRAAGGEFGATANRQLLRLYLRDVRKIKIAAD